MSFSGCSTENLVDNTMPKNVIGNDFLNNFISEMNSVIEEAIASGNPLNYETFDKIIETRGYLNQTRSTNYSDITYESAKNQFSTQYSKELYDCIEDKFMSDSFSSSETDKILNEARSLFSPSEYEVVRLIINGADAVYNTITEFEYSGLDTRASRRACNLILGLCGAYAGWLWGAAIGGPVGAVIGGVVWTVATVYASEQC